MVSPRCWLWRGLAGLSRVSWEGLAAMLALAGLSRVFWEGLAAMPAPAGKGDFYKKRFCLIFRVEVTRNPSGTIAKA